MFTACYCSNNGFQLAAIAVGRPWQVPDLELVLSGFRREFNSADRDGRGLEALKPSIGPGPLFDAAMVSFNSIVDKFCSSGPGLGSASFLRPSVPERPDAKPHMHRA